MDSREFNEDELHNASITRGATVMDTRQTLSMGKGKRHFCVYLKIDHFLSELAMEGCPVWSLNGELRNYEERILTLIGQTKENGDAEGI